MKQAAGADQLMDWWTGRWRVGRMDGWMDEWLNRGEEKLKNESSVFQTYQLDGENVL